MFGIFFCANIFVTRTIHINELPKQHTFMEEQKRNILNVHDCIIKVSFRVDYVIHSTILNTNSLNFFHDLEIPTYKVKVI